MKKTISKNYIFIMISTILFLVSSFSYFVISDIISFEKKEILNIVSIINKIESVDINDLLQILETNNTTIIITDGEEYISTDEKSDIMKTSYRVIINRFLANIEKNFHNYQDKICYIDYFKNNDEYIIIYKDFHIINSILSHIAISIILTIAIMYVIIFYMMKKIKKDVIFHMNKIYSYISKASKSNEPILEESKFEEINDIYKAINRIRNTTKDMFNDIETQNNKIEYILDNMNEGFVLFDKNMQVFTINKVAKKVLECTYEGLGDNIIYYTQNIKIIGAIEKLFNQGKKSNFDIKTEDDKIYSVYINRIEKGIFKKEYNGGIMLLIDVSVERKSEIIKQEIFSNISHELKTPITSIQGYAELLYNGFAENSEQEKQFLSIIQKECQNITSLINNILTISKLEAKFIEMNKANIKIAYVVDEIIDSTKPLCIKNNIEIFNECDETEIFADYKIMHQLLNNLIVNAIKYNKENGNVKIKCWQDDKNINISVKDTGIGIPLEDRSRIFERFYRVEKGRSKSTGGSGLGLSIVKHIMNYYNGSIKMKSKENVGTEFLMKIPKN